MENLNQDIELQDLKQKINLAETHEGLDIEDIIQVNTCCSKTSKSFLQYIAKLLISIIIVIFSMYMILTSERNSDNSIYFSLISSISSSYITQSHNEK
jgi:hypothetical protein